MNLSNVKVIENFDDFIARDFEFLTHYCLFIR
jgi:hypothetical protein